jgi:hypothetical protein
VSTEHVDLDDALVPRLRVIEEQPLDRRAEAYAQVHDELKSRLEGSDGLGQSAGGQSSNGQSSNGQYGGRGTNG